MKEAAFYSIWNDCEPNIRVLEFPSVSKALIDKYKRTNPNFNIDDEQFPNQHHNLEGTVVTQSIGPRIPSDVSLHDYQKEAISAWVGENYHGILIWQPVQENLYWVGRYFQIVRRPYG